MQFNYVNVRSDEYQKAISEARNSIIDFIGLMKDPGITKIGIVMVKVAYDPNDLNKPLIWLNNIQLIPGGYLGKVFEDYEDWKVGVLISIKANQLVDWAIIMPDGSAYGGYTIELVMSMLNDDDKKEMMAHTGIIGFRRLAQGNG